MSVASLERQLDAVARLPQTAIVDAAKAVERIARDVGATAGGVTRRGRTTKLKAITRIKNRGSNDAEATVYGVPTGPWVWANTGTRGHTIAPRRRGRGRRATTGFLKGAGYPHPYGKPVRHPGTGGKGAWRKVVAQAETEVPKVFLAAARKVMG
jgi:hypothetical protein